MSEQNDVAPNDTADPGTTDGPTGPVPASAQKDPDTWVTGDEPATGPQKSYLQTLAHEAGEDLPGDISKADASKKIDELQQETGRGSS